MRFAKRLVVTAMIGFIGVSTSACTTGPSPLPRDSSPTIHSSPSSGAGNEALPTNVHPGSTSLPWHLQRVDDTHNRIYLSSDKKHCSTPYASTVEETTTSVTITMHGTKSQEPCTADMTTLVGYVQLTTALGERNILHAATSSL
jgi:hypothetical protein